jgi:hypothetical protein
MIFEMLRWWYGTGWLQATHRIGTWTKGVERIFSISLLLKTLFSPWRRIVSVTGKSLDAKMRDAADNFVSRCVGFVIRSGVLIAACVITFFTFISSVLLVGIWPLLPFIAIYCIIRGITG